VEYVLYLLIVIGIFTILSVSLELVAGQAGLISVAQAAFYGIGAYTSALLSIQFNVPFLPGVLAGALLAALISLAVSIPSLRIRGDYFVLATFAFQMIVFSILNNWVEVTRGALGISGIPRPTIFGWTATSLADFVLLTSVFVALSYIIAARLSSGAYGRVLHAIREDEIFVQAVGKNPLRFKVTAFAFSAALASTAGSLYAHFITYIDPTSFTIMESILVLAMVIIGGAGNLWGAFVGAVLLVLLPETLRAVGFSGGDMAAVQQIIYGLLLVGIVIIRPAGLVGRYGFGRQ
jgi:branched-chain amino acid transport system permease protein